MSEDGIVSDFCTPRRTMSLKHRNMPLKHRSYVGIKDRLQRPIRHHLGHNQFGETPPDNGHFEDDRSNFGHNNGNFLRKHRNLEEHNGHLEHNHCHFRDKHRNLDEHSGHLERNHCHFRDKHSHLEKHNGRLGHNHDNFRDKHRNLEEHSGRLERNHCHFRDKHSTLEEHNDRLGHNDGHFRDKHSNLEEHSGNFRLKHDHVTGHLGNKIIVVGHQTCRRGSPEKMITPNGIMYSPSLPEMVTHVPVDSNHYVRSGTPGGSRVTISSPTGLGTPTLLTAGSSVNYTCSSPVTPIHALGFEGINARAAPPQNPSPSESNVTVDYDQWLQNDGYERGHGQIDHFPRAGMGSPDSMAYMHHAPYKKTRARTTDNQEPPSNSCCIIS